MKKSVKKVCLIILLFVLSLFVINTTAKTLTGEIVTGDSITGEATSQRMNVNISVVGPPALTIISPENKTYLTNNSLLLNYSVSDEHAVWYNLDGGANTTITSYIYFNISQGSHILYLYANNSNGTREKSINFLINSTRFIVLYSEYNGSLKGNSTDFNRYTYEDIQNVSNIILENTNHGKILFNSIINLTDDEDPVDNLLDLDSHINISHNRTELNSSAISNFNVSATLWFYNLNLSNPRILKDGELCPRTECIKESYSGRTLKFNVTSFSVYTAEETPVEEIEEEAPSPGGGSAAKKLGFEVEPEVIKIIIKKEDTFETFLKIKNTETSAQNFKIETEGLEDFIYISEKEFSINALSEKEIPIIFSTSRNTKEDTYTGKIKISTSTAEKEIPIVLGVESRVVLFDITLTIPPEYKGVKKGEKVLFEVSIFNTAGEKETEVELEYFIKDFRGNIIVEEKETIRVGKQASFQKSMKIPRDAETGQYAAITNVKYGFSVGTSSDIFYVGEVELARLNKILQLIIVIGIVVCILGIIWIIDHYKKKIERKAKTYAKKIKKIEKKVKKKRIEKTEAKRIEEKTQRRLVLLNQAYEKGYITKRAYKASKSKINKEYKRIKRKYL